MQTVGHEYDERFGYHIIGDHGMTCGGPACEYAPCDFRERYRGMDTPAPITGKHSHRIEGGEMIECDTDHYIESLNPPKGATSYEAYRPVPEGEPLNLVVAALVRRDVVSRRLKGDGDLALATLRNRAVGRDEGWSW